MRPANAYCSGAILVTLLFAGGAAALSVEDDLGRKVELARPAERIVTLSPHATELALAAGLDRRLVAIASGGREWPETAGLPRVGGAGAIDRELLLAIRPDLVIGWHSGNRPTDLAWLERQGFALFLSEPRGPSDVAATLRALGKLGATRAVATKRATELLDGMQGECSALPAIDAYIRIWDKPAMTVGGGHWINPVLRAAGFRNVFEDEPLGVFTIAEEARFRYRDHVSISLVRTFDDTPEDRLAELLSLPGPRLDQAVRRLCAKRLGPEAPPPE